jgi:UDP-N-acetyl-2-amino-2-deoxyglucuronate dehydrogenase
MNFVILGVGGYVAPRHMKAIKDTGHQLIAAMDPSDSVGILDSYFPQCYFFTSIERLDRHLEKLKLENIDIDYLVVCSPNYLHDAHIRFGLRHNANIICEKPLVINSRNLKSLELLQKQTGKTINTILQLRLHPEIIELKKKISNSSKGSLKHDVELTYIAGRGHWYYASWKGKEDQSGGIVCNIGIHLFDMLLWVFGSVLKSETHQLSFDRASGIIETENATVKWFLSTDKNLITENEHTSTHRSLSIGSMKFNFSTGFENLHTESYNQILNFQRGYSIDEVKDSILLTEKIRCSEVLGPQNYSHPYSKLPIKGHPFE